MSSSSFEFTGVTEAGLNFTCNDLTKDNVFRGVPGFLTKYFETNSCSAAVQKTMQKPETVHCVNSLIAEVLNNNRKDAMKEWIVNFQNLLTTEVTRLSFLIQSVDISDSISNACLYIRANFPQVTEESTQVFGEYHHDSRNVLPDDDKSLLCFLNRAQQLFARQPTRRFLHAFIVYGSILELWVFDRSGAFSSGGIDLKEAPYLLVQTLTTYTMMNNNELGLNEFMKYDTGQGSYTHVTFDSLDTFYLRPDPIAAPDYIVGPGTACYTASTSKTRDPSVVIKFSWRKDEEYIELKVLERISQRNVQGVVRLVAARDHLSSIADLRRGLHFPRPFQNSTLSCIAITPLGSPLQQFSTIRELLEVLHDVVKALQSLYIDGRYLHRDIAIKNIVRYPKLEPDESTSRGLVIDLDSARDLDDVLPTRSVKGSDGFIAISVLLGQEHTYRTDLESLFYVFLWLAIGNEREYEHPSIILLNLPETSRLRRWVSKNHESIAHAKIADMSLQGFQDILNEFSDDFVHLRGLAKDVHRLIFRPSSDGTAVIGTETDQAAAIRLYKEMSDAFSRQSLHEVRKQRSL